MNSLLSLLCCGLTFAISTVQGQSPMPKLLPFQGRLTNADGKPVPDGVRLVQFQIYSDLVGGTVLWAGELHRATINAGLVNVVLGAKNPLPEKRVDEPDRSFFHQPLYLQITVDANDDSQITAADPPLLPRQAIVPAVFANEAGNARTLNGYDWTPFFGSSDPAKAFISESRLPPGAIFPRGGMILSTNTTPPAGFLATGRVFSPSPVSVAGVASPTNRVVPTFVSAGTDIYVFGGSTINGIPLAITERYNLDQGTWERLQDMPVARQFSSGVSLGGQIYAIGGLGAGDVILTRVDAFRPSSNQWTLQTQLPDTRIDVGVGADGDFIYVFGGATTTTSRFDLTKLLDSAHRYSVQSNQWETLPKMPRARSSGPVVKINGNFFVFGGISADQAQNSDKIDVYEIATGKWTQITGARNLTGPTVLTVSKNNLIYSLGQDFRILTEFDPGNGNVRHYSQPIFQAGNPQVVFAAGSGLIVFTDGNEYPPRFTPERFDLVPDLTVYVRP